MSRAARPIEIVFYTNCLGRGGGHQTFLAWFDLLKESADFRMRIFAAAEGWFTEQLTARNIQYELLPMPEALAKIRHGNWHNRVGTAWKVLTMVPGLMRSWIRVGLIRADVVVLTGGRDFLMLMPLAFRLRRHTVTVPQTTDWGEIPTCRLMCRVAGRTYAISQSVADTITAMGIPREKVSVHPLIYSNDNTNRYPAKPDLRKKLKWLSDAPVIGMTGVIRPHKGQKEAILVLELLRQYIPSARLVIVGSAPPDAKDAQDYNEAVYHLVEARGLKEHVEFLGWRNDIPEIMRAMDVMLVPSHHSEGVPRVILEALEAGLPIVASDLPQFREILQDHETGFLHPIDRLDRWADEIRGLLQDKHRLSQSGARARTVWSKYYSFESARPKILSAFRALAPQP